ncbi:dual specificity protein phosphatase family protein [Halovenus salina]|uniref:Dual specificity protein phosphatase family protein n=1 Tax=Halovenus salina TaxID=1510225 RepID=A0ABD5WBQ0_9EURY|nr:dual specificity protein phosphatase [Halovenus salina]
MREVTEQLYYGGTESAANHDQYQRHGIEHVIQLTYEEPTGGYPDHVDVYTFSMMDGPQNNEDVFRAAVSKAVSLVGQGHRVLVHCSAGQSRSVCVTAATLSRVESLSFDEAFERLRETGPVNTHETLRDHGRSCCR